MGDLLGAPTRAGQPTRDWEYEIAADLAPHLASARLGGRAYRTSHPSQAPDGAAQALRDAVGGLGAADLFVIPAATRPARARRRLRGAGYRHVFSPLQVLGVGEHGVALWVDGLPQPRVWVVIRYADLTAVQERRNALSRTVTLHGAGRQLPLSFHAVPGDGLEPLLLRTRRAAAAAAPGADGPADTQPPPPASSGTSGMLTVASTGSGSPDADGAGTWRLGHTAVTVPLAAGQAVAATVLATPPVTRRRWPRPRSAPEPAATAGGDATHEPANRPADWPADGRFDGRADDPASGRGGDPPGDLTGDSAGDPGGDPGVSTEDSREGTASVDGGACCLVALTRQELVIGYDPGSGTAVGGSVDLLYLPRHRIRNIQLARRLQVSVDDTTFTVPVPTPQRGLVHLPGRWRRDPERDWLRTVPAPLRPPGTGGLR